MTGLKEIPEHLRCHQDKTFNGFLRAIDIGDNSIYRSSQPDYEGKKNKLGSHIYDKKNKDSVQVLSAMTLKLLAAHGIKCIISLNSCGITKNSEDRLLELENEINFIHHPVTDYTAPTVLEMTTACKAIADCLKKGGNVLVYCGAGIGRTGTLISAFQLFTQSTNPHCTETDLAAIVRSSTIERSEQWISLIDFFKQFPYIENFLKSVFVKPGETLDSQILTYCLAKNRSL